MNIRAAISALTGTRDNAFDSYFSAAGMTDHTGLGYRMQDSGYRPAGWRIQDAGRRMEVSGYKPSRRVEEGGFRREGSCHDTERYPHRE